ncbi:MAG: WecB/TagA/CpsF family glycosyltransferase [Elusimicrobia bacterium]|nr:WecB/TagA/CpsF family glycosyltransferase [Elusimicrobiota bacterium]
MQSIKILSIRVDRVTFDETLPLIHTFLTDGSQHQLITANPLMLLEAQKDSALKNVFDKASLVLPESSGIFWASKFSNTPLKEKIPGIDFMNFLLNYAQANNHSVFFLGAKEEVITKAVQNIKEKFPELKIAGYNNGYFSDKEESIISKIKTSKADILFVGLNIPFQEKWINKNLKSLGAKIAVGVGGSYDVFSGNLKRAPIWMIKLQIEWLFRLIQQPWRITRILKLSVFIIKVINEKLSNISSIFSSPQRGEDER